MLRVTKLTDYATVVLTVLADQAGRVHSAAELAERSRVVPATVAKVLKLLAQAGLVESFRGANGGYRLARPPERIRLADIVEALEGPLGMTACSVHDGDCGIESHCGIRAGWQRINDVLLDTLQRTTLADMLAPVPATATPAPKPTRAIPAALITPT